MNDEELKTQTVEVAEIEIERRREEAKRATLQAKHNWKQKGGYITCTACPFPHGIRVAGGVKMIGISENNMPIFETR